MVGTIPRRNALELHFYCAMYSAESPNWLTIHSTLSTLARPRVFYANGLVFSYSTASVPNILAWMRPRAADGFSASLNYVTETKLMLIHAIGKLVGIAVQANNPRQLHTGRSYSDIDIASRHCNAG